MKICRIAFIALLIIIYNIFYSFYPYSISRASESDEIEIAAGILLRAGSGCPVPGAPDANAATDIVDIVASVNKLANSGDKAKPYLSRLIGLVGKKSLIRLLPEIIDDGNKLEKLAEICGGTIPVSISALAVSALDRIDAEWRSSQEAQEAARALAESLSDGDRNAKKEAMWALAVIQKSDAFEPVYRMFYDLDPAVRAAAEDAMNKISVYWSTDPMFPMAMMQVTTGITVDKSRALVEQYKTNPSGDYTFENLVIDKTLVDELIDDLENGATELKAAAAEALGRTGERKAVAVLIRKLSDPDYFVFKNSFVALERLDKNWRREPGVKKSVDRIASIASEKGHESAIQIKALQAVCTREAIGALDSLYDKFGEADRKLSYMGFANYEVGFASEFLVKRLDSENYAQIFYIMPALEWLNPGWPKDGGLAEKVFAKLKNAVKNSDQEIRRIAVEALSKTKLTDAREYFVGMLEDTNEIFRANAVYYLGKTDALNQMDSFLRALKDKSPIVRNAATQAIREAGSSDEVGLMVKKLASVPETSIGGIVETLDRLEPRWREGGAAKSLAGAQNEKLSPAANIEELARAVNLLGFLKSVAAREKLIKIMEAENNPLSGAAAVSLFRIDDTSAVDLIEKKLAGRPSREFRTSLLSCLAPFDAGSAKTAWLAAILCRDRDEDISNRACEVLRYKSLSEYSREALEAIAAVVAEGFKSDFAHVRKNCANVAGELKQFRLAARVMELLGDKNDDVRYFASLAISSLATEENVSELIKFYSRSRTEPAGIARALFRIRGRKILADLGPLLVECRHGAYDAIQCLNELDPGWKTSPEGTDAIGRIIGSLIPASGEVEKISPRTPPEGSEAEAYGKTNATADGGARISCEKLYNLGSPGSERLKKEATAALSALIVMKGGAGCDDTGGGAENGMAGGDLLNEAGRALALCAHERALEPLLKIYSIAGPDVPRDWCGHLEAADGKWVSREIVFQTIDAILGAITSETRVERKKRLSAGLASLAGNYCADKIYKKYHGRFRDMAKYYAGLIFSENPEERAMALKFIRDTTPLCVPAVLEIADIGGERKSGAVKKMIGDGDIVVPGWLPFEELDRIRYYYVTDCVWMLEKYGEKALAYIERLNEKKLERSWYYVEAIDKLGGGPASRRFLNLLKYSAAKYAQKQADFLTAGGRDWLVRNREKIIERALTGFLKYFGGRVLVKNVVKAIIERDYKTAAYGTRLEDYREAGFLGMFDREWLWLEFSKYLVSPDKSKVVRALNLIAIACRPDDFSPILRLLNSGDPEIYDRAAYTLGRLGWKPKSVWEKIKYYEISQNIDELVKLGPAAAGSVAKFLNCRAWHLRRNAIDSLVRVSAREKAPLIMKSLKYPNVEVRVRAARAMGELKYKPAVDGLLHSLDDWSDIVRAAAIEALIEVDGGDNASEIAAFLKTLKHCSTYYEPPPFSTLGRQRQYGIKLNCVQAAALKYLKRSPRKKLDRVVEMIVETRDPDVMAACASALSSSGFVPANEAQKKSFLLGLEEYPRLIELKDPFAGVREALERSDLRVEFAAECARLLGEIGETRAVELLKENLERRFADETAVAVLLNDLKNSFIISGPFAAACSDALSHLARVRLGPLIDETRASLKKIGSPEALLYLSQIEIKYSCK